MKYPVTYRRVVRLRRSMLDAVVRDMRVLTRSELRHLAKIFMRLNRAAAEFESGDGWTR
jgi:hypothetical protein